MKPTLEQTQFCSQITTANRSESESNPVMPPILQERPAMHQAKGESGDSTQHSHTQQCGRYQTLRIWGHILVSLSGLAGTTLSYLYPTAGKVQVSPSFTITIVEDKPNPVKGLSKKQL